MISPLLKLSWGFKRKLSLAVALGIFFTGAAAVTIFFLWPMDPDRPLHSLERDLHRGQTVTLIGRNDSPVWFRWQAGETTSKITSAKDQSFTILAWHTALLELLPEPQIESFRISADVREFDGRTWGSAGLYFRRTTFEIGKSRFHWMCDWTFIDRQLLEEQPHLPAELQGTAIAQLSVRCFKDEAALDSERRGATQSCLGSRFRPEAMRDWHRLALEVTPEWIRVALDGQQVGEERHDRLLYNLRVLRENLEHTSDGRGFTTETPYPALSARGGVGLFVDRCVASFRNVTIEPFTNEH
jgi:hypothetical protein